MPGTKAGAAKARARKAARPQGNKQVRTPEHRKLILEAIAGGLPKTQAWRLAGIAESTFYEWINTDEGFAEAIEHARGLAMSRKMDQLNALIASQNRGSATAIMFWMERMIPEFKYKAEVTTGLSEEDRRAIERVRELEEIDDGELFEIARAAKIEPGGRDRSTPHRERARAAAGAG